MTPPSSPKPFSPEKKDNFNRRAAGFSEERREKREERREKVGRPIVARDERSDKSPRVQLLKVSVKPFQRLAQVEGVKPSSRSAEREIPLAAFLFCEAFFFVPFLAKKKACERFNKSTRVQGEETTKEPSPTVLFEIIIILT